ncbi:MAG TPA: hypothetical protein VEA38_11255 [Terriglobales bacterium]|nr:hypothetical protein [Terriglobales bacterium]
MSKRRLPHEMSKRVGDLIRSIVENDFGGLQNKAAEALDLSPAHLSLLLQECNTRGPGIATLLAIHDHTGLSIDEILGLELPSQVVCPKCAGRGVVERDAAKPRRTQSVPTRLGRKGA